MRVFLFFIFGIISFGSRAYAAGGVYQCIPCPAGIDCPAGTNEADIAEDMASQSPIDGNPVGTIIALAKSKGDEFGGYLLCNGQDIPIGTKYNALREFLGDTYGTGKVPNFQGHFLRGVGGNAAAAGTEQGDAIRNITGNIRTGVYKSDVAADNTYGAFKTTSFGSANHAFGSGGNNTYDHKDTYFDLDYLGYPTAAEIRPANYAVYYYIKY
jgi:microcystin-dependent protein